MPMQSAWTHMNSNITLIITECGVSVLYPRISFKFLYLAKANQNKTPSILRNAVNHTLRVLIRFLKVHQWNMTSYVRKPWSWSLCIYIFKPYYVTNQSNPSTSHDLLLACWRYGQLMLIHLCMLTIFCNPLSCTL